MNTDAVAVLGKAMTDLGRRDLTPEQMAHQVATEALNDAGIGSADLSLVLVGNALGGRLCDQGCIRGQSWLRKADLADTPVINIDNSCAGGSSALHLGMQTVVASERPVLVLGVEKMWTGDREATLSGIEDGLPSDYRGDMHARLQKADGPRASVLMSLNAHWAAEHMRERSSTVEEIASAAVKARHHASLNPQAQIQQPLTLDDVLAAPPVAGVLTRPMCSSFTDGAAALVLGPVPAGGGADGRKPPRIIGSVTRSGNGELDYHDRLERTITEAWEELGLGPEDFDLVELHDATSAEELYALESLGFFGPGEAGPATLAGRTTIGGDAVTVNPSGGLVARGHPLAATGLAQVVELATQVSGQAGPRQVPGARLGVAVNTGGVVEGDTAFVGVHVVSR